MTTHNPSAPVAPVKPHVSVNHGIERSDPYHWLRDENWQAVMRDPSILDGEIRAYLEAENAFTAQFFEPLQDLSRDLFEEMKGRVPEADISVPTRDGDYEYAVRYVEGGQHPHLIRIDVEGKEEQTLLDGDKEAEDKEFFTLGGSGHSPDHTLLAWSCDDKGSEFFTLRFRDLATGEDLQDVIQDVNGGGVWSADSRHFFYVHLDENHRPCEVRCHQIGTSAEDDITVYTEADAGMFVGLGKSQSGDFIFIDSHDHETSEVRLLDAHKPDSVPVLIAEREEGCEYDVDEANGTLFIRTNAHGAEDFKIVTAPAATPEKENWQELIAHQAGRYLLQFAVFKEHLVWMERVDGLPRIFIRFHESGDQHAIAFEEEAYALGFSSGYEFDTSALRFTYSSMTTPGETYDYDVKTRSKTLRKRREVPSGHNADDYVTRRVFAPARDGEKVPVTLLYARSTKLDGTAPCLLYGYGSYGITIPAGFNSNALSLADRGFVYAVAHIRGGKDKGQRWYNDGKREKKQNTFTDFIDCADFLANEKIVDGDNIVGHGGSAGGMLMGAIANLAPHRFAGIIADVPFVDVLTTMLDDTLPLTPPEWPEWGNPIASREDYETIAAYSPYDNIVGGDYPAIFALGGLTDPRVTYWEPAKWVARLRAETSGKTRSC